MIAPVVLFPHVNTFSPVSFKTICRFVMSISYSNFLLLLLAKMPRKLWARLRLFYFK